MAHMRLGTGHRRDPAMTTSAVVSFLPLVLLVVLVLTVPVLVLTLAYASPPDSSWICGMYDDADYDDVVTLVTSATGHLSPIVPVSYRPAVSSVERVPPFIEPLAVPPSLFSSPSRAPPVPARPDVAPSSVTSSMARPTR
jgi:hypothetical protein